MSLKLRKFVASDAAVILSWCPDELAFRKWTADRYPSYPIAPEELTENYGGGVPESIEPESIEIAEEGPFFQAVTMVDEEGTPRGSMILRRPDENDPAHIRFGFIIVDSSLRGKGYGKAMLNLAIDFARNNLGTKTIDLGVFRNNDPAYYCYHSVGFEKTGESEDCQLMGETWTFDFMSLQANP